MIQMFGTRQRHTDSTLLQIIKNFKKYFQSETKHIKIQKLRTKKKNWKKRGCMENSHLSWKNWWIRKILPIVEVSKHKGETEIQCSITRWGAQYKLL